MKKLLTILLLFLCSLSFGQSQYIIYSGDSVVYHDDSVVTITLDTDAVKYITAVENAGGTLTIDQILNVDWFFKALKSIGYFTSRTAIYLNVGGSAATCAINARDTSNFRADFYNYIAGDFDQYGYTGDGASKCVNTNIIPATHLTRASMCYFLATPTNHTSGINTRREVGSYNASDGDYIGTGVRTATNVSTSNCYGSTFNTDRLDFFNTAGGIFFSNRTALNQWCVGKDGTVEGISTNAISSNLPTSSLYLDALSLDNVSGFFSTAKITFFMIGDEVADEDIKQINAIIKRFISNK